MMIPRLFFVSACAAMSLGAAPPLTTIQDVLYKADGTRFNGSLTISWTSFEAIDRSVIAQQATTVNVVNGYLQVQLVPSTTATPTAYYKVAYQSDGHIQFQETWAVPSSVRALRVREVRIADAGAAGADTGATTPLQEADIPGLVSDLGARPLKGPGYAAGRVAWVNASGAMETVTGAATDCVRVDGSSGPCGGSLPNFVDNDSPAGLVDGANAAFTLTGVPNPATSLTVYRNGVLQKAAQDFVLTGNQLAFVGTPPQPGDTLLASYRLAGGADTTPQLFSNPQVLCSGLGGATAASALASVGTCNIPAAFLAAGDRVEIRFDLEHQGSAGGFTFEVHWGGTTVLSRNASAIDVLASGRADAALTTQGAQLSYQSWGTSLAFAAGVGKAADDFAAGIAVDFQAKTAQGGDTVALRNFTVVRLP
jgi:hypothetical protein